MLRSKYNTQPKRCVLQQYASRHLATGLPLPEGKTGTAYKPSAQQILPRLRMSLPPLFIFLVGFQRVKFANIKISIRILVQSAVFATLRSKIFLSGLSLLLVFFFRPDQMNWNVFPSLQPISLAPIEISIHIYSLFSYYQLKFLSFFTTYFPITNWNVFPSLQPISLLPIEMSFHLYNLFPYRQLKCPSIFKTCSPVTIFFVLSSFHTLFPYDQFHCCPPTSISSFKTVALQRGFPRIFCTPLLSNCKNHRVTVFSILTVQFDLLFSVFH